MQVAAIALTMCVLCSKGVLGQTKMLTNDPLTNLPIVPSTETVIGGKSFGNEPTAMPDGRVCKSKMQGNFYELHNTNTSDVVKWYASRLSNFKRVESAESGRAQIVFFNADRTLLVIVTGDPSPQGHDTSAYAVAYEKYQPALADKTIISFTKTKIVCQ